ncbi:hypothetical protein [Desulfotomaculum sp. 1211_IL3151]|uniref:hypothetical protein n=1 Tax=Desulfotomaculum sp. 1211_IL3151 TaxID=3084055 RepID=UPI002FDAE0BB
MARLTEQEIQNNIFKKALDREMLRQAKYNYLTNTVKDKRLKKLFKVFDMTATSHIAELKQEMQNLDIK